MPDEKDVLLLHLQGLSIAQIAERLGSEPDDVRGVVTRQWAKEKDGDLMRNKVAGRRASSRL